MKLVKLCLISCLLLAVLVPLVVMQWSCIYEWEEYPNYSPPFPETRFKDVPSHKGLSVDESEIEVTELNSNSLTLRIPYTIDSGSLAAHYDKYKVKAQIRGIGWPRELTKSIKDLKAGDHSFTVTVYHYDYNLKQNQNYSDYSVGYNIRSSNDSVEVSGSIALSRILETICVNTDVPDIFPEGSNRTVRVQAFKSPGGEPCEDEYVSVELISGQWYILDSISGRTDRYGEFSGTIEVPENASLSSASIVTYVGKYGNYIEKRKTVRIESESNVYITTDKPRYQPGQTIHTRALVLEKPSRIPVQGEDVVFMVVDGDGNKLDRTTVSTNDYGISSFDFKLAGAASTGEYSVICETGAASTSRKVTVEYYTLPRYEAIISTNKNVYMPGEEFTGTVELRYFFGKPVSGGDVRLYVDKQEDGERTTLAILNGKTSSSGLYAFSGNVPTGYSRSSLDRAGAYLLLRVEATDTADQEIESSVTIPVAESDFRVLLVPASRMVKSGAKNGFYVITASNAGLPVSAEVSVSGPDGHIDNVTTSAMGCGYLEFDVASGMLSGTNDARLLQLSAVASTSSGTAERYFRFSVEDDGSWLLVKTDRFVYSGGESIMVAMTSAALDNATLEIYRETELVSTSTVEFDNSISSFQWALPPDANGNYYVEVKGVNGSGDTVKDWVQVYVVRPTDLTVNVSLDKDTYKPRETAVIDFEVRDRTGAAVQAALGVTIVDEAVFHVTGALDAGTEDFFNDENGAERTDIQGYTQKSVSDDANASVVLTGAVMALQAGERFFGSIYSEDDYLSGVSKVTWDLEDFLSRLAEDNVTDLSGYDKSSVADKVARKGFYDPWGLAYEVLPDDGGVTLRSAGPDETAETMDDIEVKRAYK